MKVYLFARRYPPSVGGMELYSKMLDDSICRILPRSADFRLISYSGKRSFGFFWWSRSIVILLWRRLMGTFLKRNDTLIFSDAFASTILGWASSKSAFKVVFTFGLDLTWPNKAYQALLRPALAKSDVLIACSRGTAELVFQEFRRPAQVLYPRIEEAPSLDTECQEIQVLEELFSLERPDSDARKMLLLLGRNVPRKGFQWFITEVLPFLNDSIRCVIAGPNTESLAEVYKVRINGFARYPQLDVLGSVSDNIKLHLMNQADLFIQPNVPVLGDVEGFGIVIQEAAIARTFVVASDTEGLRESVSEPRIGRLLRPKDADLWISELNEAVGDDDLENKKDAAREAALSFNSANRVDDFMKGLLLKNHCAGATEN